MDPLLLIIHLSFGLFSWILYFLVNRFIYRHKEQFNPGFRRLWYTFAIVNFLQYILMKLTWQIPLHTPAGSQFAEFLNDFPYQEFLTAIHFFKYYFVYSQRICVFLIIAISFRVIVFPFSSAPVWERNYYLTAFLVFAIPFPFVYYLLFTEPTFHYFKDLDGYILCPSISNNFNVVVRSLLQSNFFEIATALICATLQMTSLYFLSMNAMRRRDDRNLYVVDNVIFMTSIFKFFCAILILHTSNTNLQMFVLYLYPMLSDLSALIAPYILLFMNSRMRVEIFQCSNGMTCSKPTEYVVANV